jgi:Cu(I)/Ag(I) efflux system protein CusF
VKNALTIIALIALPVAISGCQKKAEAPANSMANMAMPAETKMGSGTGRITSIDKVAGKVTLDHSAILTVGWPAMTMEFSAKPEVLQAVSVGDIVNFDVTVTDGSATVTKIAKRKRT